MVTDQERTRSIVDGLQNAELFGGGLSQVLDDVAEYHPDEVKEALTVGLLKRKGDVAVLFAAMLFYIFGKAEEPFDMAQRPFFLHLYKGGEVSAERSRDSISGTFTQNALAATLIVCLGAFCVDIFGSKYQFYAEAYRRDRALQRNRAYSATHSYLPQVPDLLLFI